ncbi:hypothetical protein CJU90_6348 [Yarrowia sp. C11]|nr:hypothetical protein CJU90_6348 [Yarrowia sp. C11]KAG5371050.1 hypothetical protein CKK34_1189 [Yarrowia sp. E02]
MSDKEGEVELRALESLMESIQAMDGTVEGGEGQEDHPPAEFEPFDELGHDWNQVEPAQESHNGPSDALQHEQDGAEQQQHQEQQEQQQQQGSQGGEQQEEIDLSGLLANVQTLMGGDSLEGLWNVEHDEPGLLQQEEQAKETREEPQTQEPEPVKEQSQDRVEEVQDAVQDPLEQRVDASENNDDDSEMFSLPEGLAELTETLKGLPQDIGEQLQESEDSVPDQDALAALTEAINAHAQSQQDAENAANQAQEAVETDKPISPAPEAASEPFETSHEQFAVPEPAESASEKPAPPTEESAVAQPSEDDISLAVSALSDAISASNTQTETKHTEGQEQEKPVESQTDPGQGVDEQPEEQHQQEAPEEQPQILQEQQEQSQEEPKTQEQAQDSQPESQPQEEHQQQSLEDLGDLGELTGGIEATLEAALGAVNDAVMKHSEEEQSQERPEETSHEAGSSQQQESFPQDFQFDASADDLAELRRTLESEVAAANKRQEQQHRQSQPPIEEHIDPSLQGGTGDTSLIDPGLMGQGESDKGKEPAGVSESTEGFNLDFGDIEKLITQSLNEKRRESINKRKESISDITWQQLQQHLHGLQQGEESAVYEDEEPAQQQVLQPRQRQTQPRSRPTFTQRRPRSPQPDHEQQLKQQMHQFQIERPAQSAQSQQQQQSVQQSQQQMAITPDPHFQPSSSTASQSQTAQTQQQTEEEPINEILMNALAMAMNEDGTEEPQHRPLPDQGQIDFTKFDGLEPEESGENLSLDQESSAALLETLISSGVNVDQSFLDQLSTSAGKGDSSQMAVDTLRQKRPADSMIEPSGAAKRFRNSNSNSNNNNLVAAQGDGEDPILAAFLLAKQVISQTQMEEDDDVSPDAIEAIQAALDSLGPAEGYPFNLRRKSQGFSEQHREEIREANRNRKKQWRVINSDRNKDNDLRCRVHKRANIKFGPDDSDEKSEWIEVEYTKRRRKRLARSEMAERNRQQEQFLPGAEHLRTLLESLGENDALENFNNAISSLIKDPKLLQEVTAKVNEGGRVLNGSLEGIAGLLTVNLNGGNGGTPRPGLNPAGGGKILSFKLDHHTHVPPPDVALEAANKPIFNIHEPVKECHNLNSLGSSSQPFLPLSPVMEPIMPPPKPKPPKPTKKVEDMTMEERLEYIMQTDPEDRVDLKQEEVPDETFVDPKFEKQLAAITGEVGSVQLEPSRPPATLANVEHRPPPFWGKAPSNSSSTMGHLGSPGLMPVSFKSHLLGGDRDTQIIKPPQYSVPAKSRAGGVAGALASRMEDKKAASLGFPPLLAAFRDKME